MGLAIGVDIGTSGIRAQAIDLENGAIVSTAITLHNPLPGANSVEHLHFSMKAGAGIAQRIVVNAISALLASLEVDLKSVVRLAVCGNPTQLSIFQGIEIRDLAFGGDRTLKGLGVERLERRSRVIDNESIGLGIPAKAEVCIPPSIRQQIGADAIAMLLKSGALHRRGNCLVTDYGTNAEIGLKIGDDVYTGSCAAGPAIEGGELEKGMLAAPGAIADVAPASNGAWAISVLDRLMLSKESYAVDPVSGRILERLPSFTPPAGITGTGTIAVIATGFEAGLIKRIPPFITAPGNRIRLSGAHDVFMTSRDYVNASRCFGAFRAGHVSLVAKSGISFGDVPAMYMCGAGGTYVDARKAQAVGLVPQTVREAYQVGNTSLAMADSIAVDLGWLDRMQQVADRLKKSYHDFATDDCFQQSYLVEMEHFERGLKPEARLQLERDLGLPAYPPRGGAVAVRRAAKRDISDFGKKGLHVISRVGIMLARVFAGCTGCQACERGCMTGALRVVKDGSGFRVTIASERCTGHACLKCEINCKAKAFRFDALEFEPGKKAW